MNFGEKLKLLRTEKNLSQKDVAEKLNISLRTYTYYELNQRRPRTQAKLRELAHFFGTPVDYLLIDDLDNKLSGLMTAERKIAHAKYDRMIEELIINAVTPFLNNLGWELKHDPRVKESLPFDCIATCNTTRILFSFITSPISKMHLTILYGRLCMLPQEQYTENYCILVSIFKDHKDIIKLNPPLNLQNFKIEAFPFNIETKEFYSKDIFKFIAKISQ